MIFAEVDRCGVLTAVVKSLAIAMARCDRCRRRVRVLPCDVPARKRYSLPAIEAHIAAYATGVQSLRDVASKTVHGEHTIAHSTVHSWTEGLGGFALGRERPASTTAALAGRLLSETRARCVGIQVAVSADLAVDERRFRSLPRKERLSGGASFLEIARAASKLPSPSAMAGWRRNAVAWIGIDPLDFLGGFDDTRIEQVVSEAAARSGAHPERGPSRCRPHERSPPGASKSSPF